MATDGHRLAQAELPLPKGANGMPGIILPRKTVHELHRLIESSEATVQVGISASKARFEIGTITLTTKLIDGTFPDYARVIPKGNDKALKVRNAEFISAVDRVSTIASERGRAVKLNINGDKLVLSVNNPEGGSATEEIGADYDATPLEIGFNARYLLDIASQLESDTAHFQLADPGSPDDGQGRQRRRRALRPDADARLTRAPCCRECSMPPRRRPGMPQRPSRRRAEPAASGACGSSGCGSPTSATTRAGAHGRPRPDRPHRPQRLRQDQPARSRLAADGGPGPAPRRPTPSWRASGAPTGPLPRTVRTPLGAIDIGTGLESRDAGARAGRIVRIDGEEQVRLRRPGRARSTCSG